MKGNDYTGIKFWNLTAIRRSDRKTKNRSWLWVFKCDCGNEITAIVQDVKSGHTKSCGCLRKKVVSETKFKHGMRNARIYDIWEHMKQRCLNSNNSRYKDYGGRGIQICNEWFDFKAFYDWAINNGYTDKLTIDRKNNNEGYSPNNCRWATMKEQQNNRRDVRAYEVNGKFYTGIELSCLTGISESVIKNRKHRKQPILNKQEYDRLCEILKKQPNKELS